MELTRERNLFDSVSTVAVWRMFAHYLYQLSGRSNVCLLWARCGFGCNLRKLQVGADYFGDLGHFNLGSHTLQQVFIKSDERGIAKL